jgi:hypothetical protein
VFDLDPAPDLDFDVVIDAAKEMRDRLSDLASSPSARPRVAKVFMSSLHWRAPKEDSG